MRGLDVAKDHRTIRITYNLTTLEIDVLTGSERVTRDELSSVRQTIDGSRYKQITGSSETFDYTFSLVESDIYDFFDEAYTNSESYDLTLSRENDDGSFTDTDIIMDRPQWQDETVGTDGKIYGNLTVRLYSA